MSDELDLNELARLAEKFTLDDRPAVHDWLTDDETDELMILLNALPRLIELAREAENADRNIINRWKNED